MLFKINRGEIFVGKRREIIFKNYALPLKQICWGTGEN